MSSLEKIYQWAWVVVPIVIAIITSKTKEKQKMELNWRKSHPNEIIKKELERHAGLKERMDSSMNTDYVPREIGRDFTCTVHFSGEKLKYNNSGLFEIQTRTAVLGDMIGACFICSCEPPYVDGKDLYIRIWARNAGKKRFYEIDDYEEYVVVEIWAWELN